MTLAKALRYIQEEAYRSGIQPETILSRSRKSYVVEARNSVMRRLYGEGHHPWRIARWMGRDRSTVIFAVEQQFRLDKLAKMRSYWAAQEKEKWG